MTPILRLIARGLAGLSLFACLACLSHAADEDVGVSSSPLELSPGSRPAPNKQPGASRSQGEFVVHNPTNLKIAYEVQWGDKGAWKSHAIQPNQLRRHWHALDGSGRAPSPNLRFDNRANDKRVTWKTYDLKFGRVGYAPSGAHVNQALHYEFVTRDTTLDLVKR